jgi:hypothetical protein
MKLIAYKLNDLEYIVDKNGNKIILSIYFSEYGISLYDGFVYYDNEKQQREYVNRYRFYCEDYNRILSIIIDEYKDESILNNYNGAENCYEKINNVEKIIFVGILHYNKNGNGFDDFLEVLNENNIKCEHAVEVK